MQHYNDKPKRKRDQPQAFPFAILSSKTPFEFKTSCSLDDCIYRLQKLGPSSTDDLNGWYSATAKTAVTISPYIGDAKHFHIQIRSAGRDRTRTKFDGYLKPLEDGDTLIQGQLILRRRFLEITFCAICTLLGIFVFQFLLAAVIGFIVCR